MTDEVERWAVQKQEQETTKEQPISNRNQPRRESFLLPQNGSQRSTYRCIRPTGNYFVVGWVPLSVENEGEDVATEGWDVEPMGWSSVTFVLFVRVPGDASIGMC
jgi:hypothetical protein